MESQIIAILSTWGLVGIFTILLLCGMGLPIPEEVTLLAAGYVASTGAFSPWTVSAVAVAGILLGDSFMYYIGRRWGRHAAEGPLRRLLTPERLARAEEGFHRRKNLFLFSARFITGVRIVAYFTAGMLRVSYWRFLVLDTLGAFVSAPSLVFAAWYLGTYLEMEDIERIVKHYRSWLFLGVLVLALVVMLLRVAYRRLKAAVLPQQPVPPQAAEQPERRLVPRSLVPPAGRPGPPVH
jgi:membrane protein DedA with SNARE-associated domain